MNTPEIHGVCDERFAGVHAAFEKNFENDLELGACFALTLEGETVVDMWAGHLDEEKTQEWERDTIINVYSTTKTMTALCALILADRGELDFTALVSKYWPEFAQNGKENVLVSHLMSHSAGLSGMEEPMKPVDLYDWEKITDSLARQAPWWEPGTAAAYHSLTQGYLVGEVVRRISGKSLGTFFRDEVAIPLDADFHIGVPPECDDRIANLVPPPVLEPDPNAPEAHPIAVRTRANPTTGARRSWSEGWRRAEIPAANGHGNARSVAEIHVVLANGGVAKGKRLLSEEGCRVALEEQISFHDYMMDKPMRYGMGFGLVNESAPFPNPNSCYWGGWGGSKIIIDFDARMTFSYVMNVMREDPEGDKRATPLTKAVFDCMESI